MKETYEEILNNSTKIIINIGKLKLKLKLLIESKLYKSLYFFKSQNKWNKIKKIFTKFYRVLSDHQKKKKKKQVNPETI